ncbi:glycosyltransferase family 2 protein [Cryomorpha ignava]|uniref:Glycosyltransferase family 2 protein n=1 Tax=Cryomorpha ignava TaxID=101383 RepID=A0A7K3WL42_9FLAO|nr:glycosyltransferase family 2 protein [Cryomorpha ignava]NEN22248.1 glycosyltransferase family 2 protein [Cryomorpha ignava]
MIGVVIITYNNEKHIIDAFQSVVDQEFTDWICVMIDNGSTDSTFEIMQRLVAGDPRFSAFKKTNEGPAAGRNLGFSKLPDHIDYVHFLDGDDMLHPSYLSTMVEYLDTHLNVGLVACQFEEIDNDGNYLGKGHRSRFSPSSFFGFPRDLPLKIVKTPFVAFFASTGAGPFGTYRRSVFVKTNGYELKSHEDTDMFCKMSLLAEVHYLPKYLYTKRQTLNNLAHAPAYRSTHGFFRRKWDFYQTDNPTLNLLIDRSIRYYYIKHVPLRHFKVSVKAFKQFTRNKKFNSLSWSMRCFKNGVMELLFKKSYKRIINKRKSLQSQRVQ